MFLRHDGRQHLDYHCKVNVPIAESVRQLSHILIHKYHMIQKIIAHRNHFQVQTLLYKIKFEFYKTFRYSLSYLYIKKSCICPDKGTRKISCSNEGKPMS